MSTKAVSLFDRQILQQAAVDSLTKLNPRAQLKNPVMFVTLIGALLTFAQLFTSTEPLSYVLQVALWLLFAVILFVAEPFILHRHFRKWALERREAAFVWLHRAHCVLLALGVVTILGAVAGSQGWSIF